MSSFVGASLTRLARRPACSVSSVHLQAATMLRRLHTDMVEQAEAGRDGKKSKRQRIVHFFRWRKQKLQGQSERAVRLCHFSYLLQHDPSYLFFEMLMEPFDSSYQMTPIRRAPHRFRFSVSPTQFKSGRLNSRVLLQGKQMLPQRSSSKMKTCLPRRPKRSQMTRSLP